MLGSFSRHFRQIVSRSRCTRRFSLLGRLGDLIQDRVEHFARGNALHWGNAREQDVKDVAQAVNVGRRRDCAPIARDLLRGHVAGGAELDVALREFERRMKALRQTEIDDERRACGVDQDIGRLQVTVQHAALVCVMNRTGHRGDELCRAFRIRERNRPLLVCAVLPSISFIEK